MLPLSIALLLIGLVAGVLGYGGVAGTTAGLAEIAFFVFLGLFLLSLLFGRRRRI